MPTSPHPIVPADTSDAAITLRAVPALPYHLPTPDESIVDAAAELRAAAAILRQAQGPKGSAALSAQLTLTQMSAKRRLIAAVLSAAAAVGYAAVDVIHERSQAGAAESSRLDQLESRLDSVAEDVAAIARALR
jgi:hypothetical protein